MQDVQIRNKYILSTRQLPTLPDNFNWLLLPYLPPSLCYPTWLLIKKSTFFFLLFFSLAVPARLVWAAPGKTVDLPCDLTPPTPQDSVKLLLWFKDTTGIPLYR